MPRYCVVDADGVDRVHCVSPTEENAFRVYVWIAITGAMEPTL